MKAIILLLLISLSAVKIYAQTCDNIPPVAIAGNDTIILNNQASCAANPIIITLDASNSYDPDGTIVSYLWSGPNGIANPNSAVTTVTGLLPGTYKFILKVTDNNGAVANDTIQISIVPSNRPLVFPRLIPIGTLSQSRSGNLTLAAAGNKILFAGGSTPQPQAFCAISVVDIYETTTGTWTTANLSEPRFDMGVAVLSDKIFFGGGFTPKMFPNTTTCYIGNSFYPETRSSVVDIYDANANTWSTSQLSTRRAPEGAAAGGKLIFAGGDLTIVAIPSNVADIYDAPSNSWTSTALAEAKSLPQIATAGNKIYLAGGGASLDADNNCLCFSKRIDIYDAVSGSWSLDSLSMERAEMASISANNKIYWAGGYIFSTDPNSYYPDTTNSVEIRDLATNTSTFECLSQPRASVTALRKNNKLIFFETYNTTFDILDLATNSWSIGLLPTNKIISVIAHNDIIYTTDGRQVWKLDIDNCTNSSASAINMFACDAYTLNGTTYRKSGIYTQRLLNAAGCDSLLTINLTIGHRSSCTTTVTACSTYTWQGQNYSVSGIYRDTLVSSTGCDSILILDLSIKNNISTTINAAICQGQNYSGYTSSGTYIDIFPGTNGCDSIRTLNLTVNKTVLTTVNASVCPGQNYYGHTAAGTYSDIFPAANGCDSIRTLILSINPLPFTTIDTAICNGQNYHGHKIAGTYTDVFVASTGCDSTRVLHLAIKNNCSIYIPVAFTPNGDGRNDVFRPIIGLSLATFHFAVFNRFGETVFSTREPGKGWDGTYKGKKQGNGSYVYIIQFTTVNGWRSRETGSVMLIR